MLIQVVDYAFGILEVWGHVAEKLDDTCWIRFKRRVEDGSEQRVADRRFAQDCVDFIGSPIEIIAKAFGVTAPSPTQREGRIGTQRHRSWFIPGGPAPASPASSVWKNPAWKYGTRTSRVEMHKFVDDLLQCRWVWRTNCVCVGSNGGTNHKLIERRKEHRRRLWHHQLSVLLDNASRCSESAGSSSEKASSLGSGGAYPP